MIGKIRIHIKPGEKIAVSLTEKEFTILLDKAIAPPDLEAALRFRIVENGQPVAKMDLDDIEELAGYVAFEANHTKNMKYQQTMDTICEKLEAVLESYSDEEIDTAGETKSENVPLEVLTLQLATGELSLDDLSEPEKQDLMERLREFVNRTPSREFGGLSPHQVHALIYSDWDDPSGAIQFNSQLDERQLTTSSLWANSRIFLQTLMRRGSFKATGTKNLNRKSVEELMEAMRIAPERLESIRRYNKVINETDVREVHQVRILLDLGGLISCRGSEFRLTRKGKTMLGDDCVGELLVLLFKTCFRKFNLAYLDGMLENPVLQQTVGYSLYRISKVLKGWRQVNNRITQEILLPAAVEAIPQKYRQEQQLWQLEARILYPLKHFGLLTERRKVIKGHRSPTTGYRKTSLFDPFLQFRLPGES